MCDQNLCKFTEYKYGILSFLCESQLCALGEIFGKDVTEKTPQTYIMNREYCYCGNWYERASDYDVNR